MIQASIAFVLRQQSPESKLFLILPEHPRVKGDKMKCYFKYFDEIVRLPYESVYPSYRHFTKCYFNGKRFKKALETKINPEEGALLFLFDLFKFHDLILLDFFKKRNIQTNVISAFVGEQFNIDKLKLLMSPTLIFTCHSLLLGLKTIFKVYARRNTSFKGYHIAKTKVNNIITIEGAKTLLTSTDKELRCLPYPVPLLFSGNTNFGSKRQRKNILILVSTIQGERFSNYWTNIKDILNHFKQFNVEVYIKDHPGVVSKAGEKLNNCEFQLIDNKINAEIIYNSRDYNIETVIGSGSTALITASWIGLKVIDISSILGYSNSTISYYNDFLGLGNNINKIKNVDNIKVIFNSKNADIQNSKEDIIKQWNKSLSQILGNEK